MMFTIIGAVIGVLVLVAGLYYLNQNKNDAESRKVYGITALISAVVAVVCIALTAL